MRKFIHLRGSMATGKTSTARAILDRGDYEVRFIDIGGSAFPYTYDEKKGWLVTGRYDKAVCGGLDGVITNREIMKIYLHRLMREIKPNVIVFEAVMYGNSFKFGKECADLCKGDGYEYIGILLAPEFDVVLGNMYKRNGGKQINVESLSQMYYGSFKAADKLNAAGVKVVAEDTSKYKLPELYKVVEKWL